MATLTITVMQTTILTVMSWVVWRDLVLTLTGASVLSVRFRLLLGKTFLWSCGLMSILESGVLGRLSLASSSSAGISSQYLHQGEGQQLQVKITSSGSRIDPLPQIAMGWTDGQWRKNEDVYSKLTIIWIQCSKFDKVSLIGHFFSWSIWFIV